jgi:two-component system, cell cycle sensor histidine kinase and response regulator CckA
MIRGLMRMPERGATEKNDFVGQMAVPSQGRSLVAVALAVVLAAAVILAGRLVATDVSPLLLIAGEVLVFIGLLALFALMAGLLRFNREGEQHGSFHDGLIDAVGDACVVTDAKSRAVYSNAAYLHLASSAGMSRLVGFDILFAGQPAFAEPIYQLAQAAADGRSETKEIRVPAGSSAPGAKPDQPVWVKLSVAPIKAEAKRGYVLWRLQDASHDRAKQEQAFSRLQFIITYLDKAPAGFFSTLPSGRVDYVNATLAEWLGIDLAETQNGKLALADVMGEEEAKQLLAVEPEPNGARTELFTMELKSRHGKLLPVDVIHRVDFDEDGKATPARTLVIPRSEQREAKADGDFLAKFFSMAPIGIAEIDRQGTIQGANSIFLSFSPQAKRGARIDVMIAEADRQKFRDGLQSLFEGHVSSCVIDVSVQGEKPRLAQFSMAALKGLSAEFTVFAVDRTESKALEVQLAQSQKMQAVGQLASGIAHDFNNVLTPIIGFADLLLAKMRPTDPAFADIMNIKQNANRAANLVRQLLAFSRRQTLQAKPHSLTEAMTDLGNLLSRVLGEKIELKMSHSRDLGLVMVDINQFEQVVINLAVNARDAMPKGGALNVRTRNISDEESRAVLRDPMPPGEYVLCEVSDTGTGIPPEILEKIWEPFFSTKEVGKGTGLGLSTVYGIVKQTGGFIFCDSDMGKGTTFSIYLPRYYPPAVEPGEQSVKKETKAQRADMTGNGRILLVEDEDSVRAFAHRALTSRGYTVVEADSGESALTAIEEEEPFDLILSDVVMPEMDGPTLLRELRKRGIGTKVIFVSGYAEDAFEKNLEGQTDFAFLPKPFSLKQLLEKVKDVMGS